MEEEEKKRDGLRGLYYNGTGVPQDHTEAARLFKLANDQG